MLELILVRHGETDSNKRGTYLGWTDVELNGEGIRQAQCTAEKLQGAKVEGIFASPLKRAAKTAEIIRDVVKCPLLFDEALKERNFGVWDDLTHRELISRYPDEYDLWTKDWKNYCVGGGESSMQAYERITTFADTICNNKTGCYVIVSHLGCIRKLIAHLLGMGIDGSWRFRVDNGSVTRMKVNEEGYAYLTHLNV